MPLPPPPPAELAQLCLALSAVVPSAATLIIVVCVGFLVLMVVLGLVRIHSLHRRVSGASGPPGASSDPKDPDLFWDDSALTIIVNPMEVSRGPGRVRVQLGRTPSRETPNERPPPPLFPSPTRAGRSAWRALRVASRTTRTAVTRRRPTRPAVTRDASSRPPLTATEASAPPQTENSVLVRQTHRRDRRTFLEERDPVGWRREVLEESSPNLRIRGPTRACPLPLSPQPTPSSVPLGSYSRVGEILAALSVPRQPPSLLTHVCLFPHRPCAIWEWGALKETLSPALTFPPVHGAPWPGILRFS